MTGALPEVPVPRTASAAPLGAFRLKWNKIGPIEDSKIVDALNDLQARGHEIFQLEAGMVTAHSSLALAGSQRMQRAYFIFTRSAEAM